MYGEKFACTLFRTADIINCIIDHELKVLVQQSVNQRGVGYTLSVCQKWKYEQINAITAQNIDKNCLRRSHSFPADTE